MKKALTVHLVLVGLFVIGLQGKGFCQEPRKDCFFFSSLHYTAKGMAYWYDKTNGGLEILTGVPYSNLGCKNCHTPGCDRCHKVEKDGKAAYSTKAAKKQEMCLECHAREQAILKIDRASKQEDVHFALGMACMDCHFQREGHGEWMEWTTNVSIKISRKENGFRSKILPNRFIIIPHLVNLLRKNNSISLRSVWGG